MDFIEWNNKNSDMLNVTDAVLLGIPTSNQNHWKAL